MTDPYVLTQIGFSIVVDTTGPHVALADRMVDLTPAQARAAEICARHPSGPGEPPAALMARTAVEVRAGDLLGDPRYPYRPVVDAFVVCGLPDGHPSWDDYAVYARCRGGDWWGVRRLNRSVTAAGAEVLSTRDESPESTPELFMDVDTALRVAEAHARTVRTRRGTAADVLADTTVA